MCAVSTQGDSLADNWVKTYSLQISTNGTFWTNYNEFGKVKVNCILLFSVGSALFREALLTLLFPKLKSK